MHESFLSDLDASYKFNMDFSQYLAYKVDNLRNYEYIKHSKIMNK